MTGVLRAKVGGQWVDIAVPTSGLMPSGGATGQMLTKRTAMNYDTQWTHPGGRLVQGQVLSTDLPTSQVLTRMTADMILPAGTGLWAVFYHVLVASVAPMDLIIRMYGVIPPGYHDHQLIGSTQSLTHTYLAPSGATVSIYGVNRGTQISSCFNDPANHALYAISLL